MEGHGERPEGQMLLSRVLGVKGAGSLRKTKCGSKDNECIYMCGCRQMKA